MKRLLTILSALLIVSMAAAQTESEKYEQRYNLLLSKLGPDGIGIETILNNWEKADSANAKMLLGKFSYYFAKSRNTSVVSRPEKKYLGMEPMLTLKDSLGNDVYYYQDNQYDDEYYSLAVKAVDKAIAIYPDMLDYRFVKANAYIAYEKDSPDMALAYLQNLVKENASRKAPWLYDGKEADKDFFEDAMQEYCFSFYTIGSHTSYEAFKTLSEQLLAQYPSNTGFMNNVGSYYLLKQEYKTALKYYDKVLKKVPDDYTAMQNGLLAARRLKNVKLEKKYLTAIVKYGDEKDRMLAKGRLDALDSK